MGVGYFQMVLRLIVMGVCIVAFWRAAKLEEIDGNMKAILWAGASAVIYGLTAYVLGWGWPGIIAGQVGLLVGIGLVRALKYMHEMRAKKSA